MQWATGGVGRAAIEGVLGHPELELVGCWVHSADKDGKDVGELVGRDPIGVTATTDVDEILALDADCVVYARSSPTPRGRRASCARARTSSRRSAGSTRTRPRSAALEAACAEGGVDAARHRHPPRRHHRAVPADGVGAVGARITHVRAEEFSDIRTYGAPDVVRDVMLFGDDARGGAGQHHGRRSSAPGSSSRCAWSPTSWASRSTRELRTTHEIAVATAPIDSPIGAIEPGLVAAQRFRWEALVDGEPVVTAAVNWLMGEEHLDPPLDLRPRGRAVRGRGHRRPAACS